MLRANFWSVHFCGGTIMKQIFVLILLALAEMAICGGDFFVAHRSLSRIPPLCEMDMFGEWNSPNRICLDECPEGTIRLYWMKRICCCVPMPVPGGKDSYNSNSEEEY